ncbi:hypothetical protein DNTS_012088 [Danionella cerebrum]|uniref:Uncharacterized protein n=1 Tax=Danionella cerebrum TaxID=2873325 RepID=A0A553PV70_9TELE|nr:hypothetical protein DNTS_012088 [Danionella translucida]TRY81577.1 hypothetical protein DNTS_012088 [Danionella translucida]
MVRPQSGSPRSKHRHFSDNYRSSSHEGRFGPPSRSQRGFRGPPGKAPPSWRDNNGSGPQPYPKRPSLIGEHRERPHGQWMQSQNHFRSYPNPQDSQRGRRRPSPPRSGRPSPFQHRQSQHDPMHGPSHRAPFFQGNHTSPSRHFHGPPSERRMSSPRESFRGPIRRPSPQEHGRSWGTTSRERGFGRPAHSGHHWNGPGGHPHSAGGDLRFSGPPQRRPREFHGRSYFPERYTDETAPAGWPADRDRRAPHGDFRRDARRPSMEFGHGPGGSPHSRPPYRPPARRPGPPPPFPLLKPYPLLRLQDRPSGRPMKRKIPDFRQPLSLSSLDHGPPKRFRRELSLRPLPLRSFRGRGLSLLDKSRLLKIRRFREESVARFKLPPPRPRLSDRFQKPKPYMAPRNGKDFPGIRKMALRKKPSLRESPPSAGSKAAEVERNSETKLESRRSVSAHSSSPIDRRLSRDLVVVSHWEAGYKPSTGPKSAISWRHKPPKNKSDDEESHGNLTLNERFSKIKSPGSSSQEKERRSSGSPPETKRKTSSFLGNFRSSAVVKTRTAPDGVLRKPLMGSLIQRPTFRTSSVLKKSQSIMSKYKNLQTLRHKASQQRQATSYRRW